MGLKIDEFYTHQMAPWREIHEELKNEKMTPILKAEECTIQLFEEVEATIVNKKIKINI